MLNQMSESVTLHSVLISDEFSHIYNKKGLSVALGRDIRAAELTKMPHALIAGATGSGKVRRMAA